MVASGKTLDDKLEVEASKDECRAEQRGVAPHQKDMKTPWKRAALILADFSLQSSDWRAHNRNISILSGASEDVGRVL